jgi:hypothetical protein
MRSRDFSMRRPASSKNGAHPVRRPLGLRSGEIVLCLQDHWDVTLCGHPTSGSPACVMLHASQLQHLVRSSGRCQNSSNLHRPIDVQTMVSSDQVVDPEGDAQDVHRFSMRQGCLIEKSRLRFRSQFRIGPECFFGYFLCAKESNSRTSAKKLPGFTHAS